MAEIVGTLKSNLAASTDVGFFGIFSGEKKDRVQLGGSNDKTNRMAIACFNDNEIKGREGEGTKWVELRLADGVSKKFEIKSIVARLGISKDKILDLYEKGGLEQEINAKAQAYQKDLEIVQDFRGAVSVFLNSKDDPAALDTFKKALSAFNPKKIENKEIKQVCEEFISEFNKSIDHVEVTNVTIKELQNELKGVRGNLPSATRIEEINAEISQLEKIDQNTSLKSNFERSLRRFDRELFGVDKNFSVKSAENNVIRTLWGGVNLVLSKAQSVSPNSTGKLATRLEFIEVPSNRFSILTTGKVFHKKPQATEDYVPYSKDGKTWVLLNIQSLASRLGINPDVIIKESEEGNLKTLIEKRLDFIANSYINIVTKFYDQIKGNGFTKTAFDVFYRTYIRGVADDNPLHGSKEYYLSIAKEIKTNLDKSENKSEAKLEALEKIKAPFIEFTENKLAQEKLGAFELKINKNNLSDFKEYRLFIKNDKLIIPLGGKKHYVDVETNGFVYRQKPESNKEYLPFQFKKGFWILLNVQSLQKDTDSIEGIQHVLNDFEELNDFINQSKK